MSNEPTLLDGIDPDLRRHLASRRHIFRQAAAVLGGLATVPTVVASASAQLFGLGGGPGQLNEVLNFALTLEYLEAEFYATGLRSRGLIPGRYRNVFQQIAKHEVAHVRTLRGALGGAAISSPQFDYTARGQYPDVFENFTTFATVASTFEDLGVAAYKGQAGNLMGTPALTTALQIHSVEARHAAELRRVRGSFGWDGAFDRPLSKAEVLAAAGPFIRG